MQGIVIDEESKYVKAAIVKMFKLQDLSDGSDTEAEAVTYALTDENGRFVIRDLDSDENYTIEIHVEGIPAKISEAATETENMDGEDDLIEEENMDGEDDLIEEEDMDEEDDFMEPDNTDEAIDLIEADNAGEAVNFFQTNSTGETIFFTQNKELAGMFFTSDLRPETELIEKLYTISNCTW